LQQALEQAAQLAVQQAAQQAQAAKEALAAKQAAERAAEQVAQPRGWQPWTDRFAQPAVATTPADAAPQFAPARDDTPAQARSPWATTETREPAGRPAWLSTGNGTGNSTGSSTGNKMETAGAQATHAPQPQQSPASYSPASYPPAANAPEDTLQGSRDRLTSRWFALRGVFDPTAPPLPEAVPAPAASQAPALAVFSLAGGVGKTSLVATLGRALSARGERVLLVDTAAFGLLPFFYGATDQRPGQLRTFSPPGVSSDAPVQMVTIDPEGLAPEQPNQESLSGEIAKFSRGASRVIVDLATASGITTRRIMRMAPLVLVPVVPDMNSVVSVSSIDAFFEYNSVQAGKTVLPYYVLNQFDTTLPLHLDVREVLREQLGERLLPFALRRTPAMSEALAEGMTVMDYAPGSTLAEDFVSLAGWVKSLSAPATTSYRGVRWSER
jgi:cellulose synthase operon protein YhjQ